MLERCLLAIAATGSLCLLVQGTPQATELSAPNLAIQAPPPPIPAVEVVATTGVARDVWTAGDR